jgi:hypothetical protein
MPAPSQIDLLAVPDFGFVLEPSIKKTWKGRSISNRMKISRCSTSNLGVVWRLSGVSTVFSVESRLLSLLHVQ